MASDNGDEANSYPGGEENTTVDRRSSWIERYLQSLFADRFLHPTSDAADRIVRARQQAASSLTSRLVASASNASATLAPHMAAQDVRFCVEDTVGLRDDKYMVGVVDRSFGDVDSHEPRPQRDYNEDIERHEDVPREQFEKFLRTGIPPRGTVLVSWQNVFRAEPIPEARLERLDRALYVGDVVKRNAKDPMSGTVIGTKAVCALFPATAFNNGQITPSATEDLSVRGVPADELLNIHEYVMGALVIYDDWVGRIEHVFDEVAVKLSNNSVVVVENPEELVPDDPLIERLSVGDSVSTRKGNLRRGLWKFGAFDPNIRPRGTVVETRTTQVTVHWLARRFGAAVDRSVGYEPSVELGLDELESSRFHVYDATSAAAQTLPILANGIDRSYHVAEVAVGDRVKFKDLAGAAVKYNGTRTLPNGLPQGKLTRIPRTETLGYEMNVYIVMQTHSQVTVQWQDLTITEDVSPSLIPDPNVEDDDEVWPGEIICTKEQRKDRDPDTLWTLEPARVGIVQTVQPRDRIATVRWFESASIRFLGEDLIPPSETGKLCEETEDVSLYDIRSIPSLTRRRGDFVLIHPSALQDSFGEPAKTSTGPTWFGEVIDLGLDGKYTVRLGAAKPVVDLRIPAERVTLVYSSDMENEFDFPTLDGDTIDDEFSDEEESDFDSASFNEMWIEYEGMDGEPLGNIDDEEWSTEDEDDDISMPDLEPAEDVDTSKTTPEAHSDSGRKSPMHIDDRLVDGSVSSQRATAGSDSTTKPHSTTSSMAPVELNSGTFEAFQILDGAPPTSHHYYHAMPGATSSTFMKRITKEHKILRSSLPPGIFVRTWESRLDLLRVLMIGPSDTPYEYAPFTIDFHLGSSYPHQAPEAFFHSWTNGNGPVNPNLYEDGKICLSLLGTWHADERNESWSPTKSTLLQVLISIHSLVLVKEPYYNEAGYDVHREAPETKLNSSLYSERAYFRARAFIVHALTNAIEPFQDEIKYLFLSHDEGAPRLLEKAIEAAKSVLVNSEIDDESERDGLRRISRGAVVMLKRQVQKLQEIASQMLLA